MHTTEPVRIQYHHHIVIFIVLCCRLINTPTVNVIFLQSYSILSTSHFHNYTIFFAYLIIFCHIIYISSHISLFFVHIFYHSYILLFLIHMFYHTWTSVYVTSTISKEMHITLPNYIFTYAIVTTSSGCPMEKSTKSSRKLSIVRSNLSYHIFP